MTVIKIYSLHEPQVNCFSKGKEHKKYEFGSKASLLITQKTGVIVGAMNFTENIHDSKTLPDALQQHQRLTGIKAKKFMLIEDILDQNKLATHKSIFPNQIKTSGYRNKKNTDPEPPLSQLSVILKTTIEWLKTF